MQCLVKMDGQVGGLAEIRSASFIKGCGVVLETMSKDKEGGRSGTREGWRRSGAERSGVE